MISQKGQPTETLANLVRLIQERFESDVRSGPPDRARPCVPGAGGDRRSTSRERRPGADGAQRGAGGPGGRGAPTDHGRRRDQAPPVQILPRDLRGRLSLVPGRPPDRARDDPGRARDPDRRAPQSREEMGTLSSTATQIGPIIGEARTLDQFIAPIYERIYALSRNFWWSWDDEAESLFNELDPYPLARPRPQPGGPALGDHARTARGT